jgi:hypothetical protein
VLEWLFAAGVEGFAFVGGEPRPVIGDRDGDASGLLGVG